MKITVSRPFNGVSNTARIKIMNRGLKATMNEADDDDDEWAAKSLHRGLLPMQGTLVFFYCCNALVLIYKR